MCQVCSATQTFDPVRHSRDSGEIGAVGAEIFEAGGDAAADISTVYSMAVGDTFRGTIASANEDDWVSITLQAGVTYVFDLYGTASGEGTLSDPYVRLYTGTGSFIAGNDDGGTGLESRLTYTASSTGTYFVEASAFSTRVGTYALEVNATLPPPVGTLDQLALQLTDGYWGNTQYTFTTNTITVNISALTAEGQQLALWAMEAWEMVANLDFQVVTSGEMITVDDEESGAWAYAPNRGSENGIEMNVSKQWIVDYGSSIDSDTLATYIHEFGHAIGLGHQGNYNGSANYGSSNDFENDSWQVSVMSYFDQTENTNTTASFAYIMSAQMSDILAIQNLYGAAGAGSVTDGNTTWGQGSTLGNYFDTYFAQATSASPNGAVLAGNPVTFTIYDVGGYDTVDISYMTTNNRIDLNDERFSDVAGLIGNVGIARGTILEALLLGSGNDTVDGNEAGNLIEGGLGNDSVMGGAGADTIRGGSGDDIIDGGDQNDSIFGGDQYDTITAGAGNDTVDGGNGRDRVFLNGGNDLYVDNTQGGDAGRDTVFAGFGEDTIQGGNGADIFHGDDGNDSITGALGDDTIYGGNQYDTILSGDGADHVYGGNGRDLVYLNQGNDVFFDNTQNDGNAHDTVFGGLGDDTINGGGGNDVFHGEDGADQIIGGLGNDSLYGGAQYDTITAGEGADRVWGGDGRDLVFLNQGNDVFNDNTQGGFDGQDTVWAGLGNDTIQGGNGDDVFRGEDGEDLIFGRLGADLIYGGNQADTLDGGDGADTIFGGFGTDTVRLGAGNDRYVDEQQTGALGNDTITGGFGTDTFVFGAVMAEDVITDFTYGEDTLEFSSALAAGRTEAQLAALASVTAEGVLITFGVGETILLDGVTTVTGLEDNISIV